MGHGGCWSTGSRISKIHVSLSLPATISTRIVPFPGEAVLQNLLVTGDFGMNTVGATVALSPRGGSATATPTSTLGVGVVVYTTTLFTRQAARVQGEFLGQLGDEGDEPRRTRNGRENNSGLSRRMEFLAPSAHREARYRCHPRNRLWAYRT